MGGRGEYMVKDRAGVHRDGGGWGGKGLGRKGPGGGGVGSEGWGSHISEGSWRDGWGGRLERWGQGSWEWRKGEG